MQFKYSYFVTMATFLCVRTEWVQIPFLPTSQMSSAAVKHDQVNLLNSQVVTDKNKQIKTSSALEKKYLEGNTHTVSSEKEPEKNVLKNETVDMFPKDINEETLRCSSRVYDKSCYKNKNNKGKYKFVINEEIEEPLKNVHEEILQEAEKHPDIKSKLVFLDDLKKKLMGHVGKLLLCIASDVNLLYS